MRQKLTKRVVDGLAPSANRYTFWDGHLAGFGVRVNASGRKSFIIRYRPRGCTEKRYFTVGRYGVLTVDEARVQARRLFGLVANGEDPAHERDVRRQIPTLSVVVEEFLKMHVAAKRKPKTLASYTHALRYHVLPKLGHRRLDEVTRADIGNLHSALGDRPFMANYMVTVLSSLYGWAERKEIIADGLNPTRRIEKFRETRRERFPATPCGERGNHCNSGFENDRDYEHQGGSLALSGQSGHRSRIRKRPAHDPKWTLETTMHAG